MTDIVATLRGLSRPRLLIEAARAGLPSYRRRPHLCRLLALQTLPGSHEAAVRLLCLEQDLEDARSSGAAEYAPCRHVEVMIALLAETRDLIARRAQDSVSATAALRHVV